MKNRTDRLRKREIELSVEGLPDHVINEMAVPSYLHRNPLIRWLMWRRLELVQDLIQDLFQDLCTGTFHTALDYGTGTGIMLPFLSRVSDRVVALDVHTEPASKLCQTRRLENVEVCRVDGPPVPLPNGSVSLILCLDVLEHVENLEQVVAELARVLEDNGILIMSGPSENVAYRLGRWAAGFRGCATYHHANVDVVRSALEGKLVLRKRIALPPICKLFEIDVFQKSVRTLEEV